MMTILFNKALTCKVKLRRRLKMHQPNMGNGHRHGLYKELLTVGIGLYHELPKQKIKRHSQKSVARQFALTSGANSIIFNDTDKSDTNYRR